MSIKKFIGLVAVFVLVMNFSPAAAQLKFGVKGGANINSVRLNKALFGHGQHYRFLHRPDDGIDGSGRRCRFRLRYSLFEPERGSEEFRRRIEE